MAHIKTLSILHDYIGLLNYRAIWGPSQIADAGPDRQKSGYFRGQGQELSGQVCYDGLLAVEMHILEMKRQSKQ
jgi:hypothetical protein